MTLNDSILPILNGITTDAQSKGLLATTMFASDNQADPFFFNSSLSRFLTVGEVLLNLNSQFSSVNSQVQDLMAQIIQLNTKLATTNQADVLSSIQGFSAQVRSIALTVNSLTTATDLNTTSLAAFKTAREDTGVVGASDTADVTVTWPTAYPDNSYTVDLSVSDASGHLSITKWVQQTGSDAGKGIVITVANSDSGATHSGTLHVIAKYDGQN
jgi:hypothetical protein